MSTDALELALALHQAPIQRFALRDRPLPANMDEVLQLASAMQPQLENAASRFSESEDTIVEAVRFYLQQVLFEPGTDAYRIFGVASNAEFTQVRQHHIWLQRWLHPDRRGEDWESALATKVNWAWQQLRNESSREEYDRSRQLRDVQSTRSSMVPVQVPAWSVEPVEPTRYWLRRVVMSSLVILCVALFYLAATRQDRVDPDVLASNSNKADSEIRARLPFVDESSRRTQQSVNSGRVESAPAPAQSTPLHTPPDSQKDEPIRSTPVAASPDPNALKVESLAEIAGQSTVALPGREAALSSSDRTAPRLALEPVVAEVSAPIPSKKRIALEVPSTSSRIEAAPPEKAAPVKMATKVAVVSQVSVRKPVRASSADGGQGSGGQKASRADSGSPTRDAPAADVHVAADATQTEWQPAQLSSRDEMHHEAALEPVAPRSIQRDATIAPADTLVRFELARKRLSTMVSYLRNGNGELPDWNDDQGRLSAARARDALHARNGGTGIDRFELDSPQWRVTSTAVAMNTTYQVAVGRSISETGRLQLDMAWQDGSWKIVRFEVLPTR